MTPTPAASTGSELNPTAQALHEHGYVVLKNLLTPAEVAAIKAELEPHFLATPRCVGDFHGWKTTRLGAVLSKAPVTQKLLVHDAIWPAAESLLRPGCDYVQLNLVQAIRVHPGERAQVPHRDEEMWPVAKQGAHWMLNVMWALDDFTEENGATRLWPGTHRETLDRHIDPNSSIAAVMPAGSACAFMGGLTHGAGANASDRDRTGIIVSYCLGWLKTYENQYLTYPPAVARTFPPAVQQLIGYRMHRPNLGSWNGQDPSVLLGEHDDHPPFRDALPPEIAAELRAYYDAA